MSSFEDLRIVDNFYQTSAFFPMPTVCISTVNPDGSLNIGSYSLCFPYYIAGKDRYAMVLECRNTSNTCQNLLRTHKCALNFIPDDRASFREAVRLGFPGPSEEKMKELAFEVENGIADPADKNRPQVITKAFQVFECTWASHLEDAEKFRVEDIDDGHPGPYNDFNGITSKYGAHFILYIDKILMKKKYYDSIVNGVNKNNFPPVPVDYGYRDSTNFWYTRFPRCEKPIAELIPAPKEVDLESIRYAADRVDDTIRFTDEALMNFVKVPRPFLKTVLNGCVEWAKENDVTLIDDELVKIINDKRAKEKEDREKGSKGSDAKKTGTGKKCPLKGCPWKKFSREKAAGEKKECPWKKCFKGKAAEGDGAGEKKECPWKKCFKGKTAGGEKGKCPIVKSLREKCPVVKGKDDKGRAKGDGSK